MTTTQTETITVRRTLTQAVFAAEAVSRFGAYPALWRFRCTRCASTQSAAECMAGDRERVAQGCWTCGLVVEQAEGRDAAGLWLVRMPDGSDALSFPLADDLDSDIGRAPSQPHQGPPQGPDDTRGPGSAVTPPETALRPGNEPHAPTPTEPFLTGETDDECEA